MENITTIDHVISALEEIILDAKQNNSTHGYFAVLYQNVTKKVKKGIADGLFEDGPRMEKLDVVFAKRYLEAYHAYQKDEPLTDSWKRAFDLSTDLSIIVLQHLLLGINAHINLDLGIAAAEISKGQNLDSLQNDFNKINDILSSMVHRVQNNLTYIWPPLKWLLKKTGQLDNLLVDFSMKIARDGAWAAAGEVHNKSDEELTLLIQERDLKVAKKVKVIVHPSWFVKMILWSIRIGEKGTVAEKIDRLKN